MQIVIAVFAFMYTKDLADAALKGYITLWDGIGSKANNTEAIYRIQSGLKCCGNKGPNDWPDANLAIPPSCCADQNNCNASSPSLFKKGCGTILHDLVSASGMLIAWIAMVFGAFEVKVDFLKR